MWSETHLVLVTRPISDKQKTGLGLGLVSLVLVLILVLQLWPWSCSIDKQNHDFEQSSVKNIVLKHLLYTALLLVHKLNLNLSLC